VISGSTRDQAPFCESLTSAELKALRTPRSPPSPTLSCILHWSKGEWSMTNSGIMPYFVPCPASCLAPPCITFQHLQASRCICPLPLLSTTPCCRVDPALHVPSRQASELAEGRRCCCCGSSRQSAMAAPDDVCASEPADSPSGTSSLGLRRQAVGCHDCSWHPGDARELDTGGVTLTHGTQNPLSRLSRS